MNTKQNKHNNTYRALKFLLLFGATIILFSTETKAQVLDYYFCNGPQEPACVLAFKKIERLSNPLVKGKNLYFHNGIHYTEIQKGRLFAFPALHVAEADIDGDGFNEVIAKLTEATEEEEGMFCVKNNLGVQECPHFIIQDRNISGEKGKLENYRIMGPIFGYFIGLKPNERFSKYMSLVSYHDVKFQKYSIWQYDGKNDNYYNVERP